MTIPFSQSMRSLQVDRGTSSRVGLVAALILLLLWAIWFFWAPITRYETGTIARIDRDGRVIATFPATALTHIWQGQRAYIRPQGVPVDERRPIPAVVANLLDPIAGADFQVSFSIQWDAIDTVSARLLEQAPAGEVVVEVERVSPATLVARASGQFLAPGDTSGTISLSPQRNP
jgi:hypothetical protein